MDRLMEPFDQVIKNLSGLQACNYSSMGALAFTIYDMMLSLEEEVEQVWMKPWTNLKRLYLMIRLISFVSQVVSTGVTLNTPFEVSTDLRGCRSLAEFQGASSQVLMITVQVILVLRVQALFYEKPHLRYALYSLFATEVITMSAALGLAMPDIEFGSYCVITSFPPISVAFLLPPILFEFLLFILTMVRFYCAVREGWGRQHFMSRFTKDGIWVFAIPFTMLMTNTCCIMLISGALSSVAYSWAIAIPGFAGCRLILNMSHLLTVDHTSHFQSDGNQDMFETIVFTNDARTDNTDERNEFASP